MPRSGRIDILVNNAGSAPGGVIEHLSEEEWASALQLKFMGYVRAMKHVLPIMQKQKKGRVVNVASLSGKRVKNAHAGYAMTKFALMALTHSVRRLGWEHGIRATAICPSFVATDMTADVQDVDRAEMIPPAEIAELVATVLSLPNNAAIAELLCSLLSK